MKEGINIAFVYKNPKNVAIYIYKYLKWCYYNFDLLTYSVFFKAGISLIIPFWVYLKICRINWNEFFRYLFEYIWSMFKTNSNNNNNENFDFNNSANIDFRQTDYSEEIYRIKKNAMIKIEESVNKMASEILCIKNKRNDEHNDNIFDKN